MSTKRKTTEQFIVDAKKVHGDRYDYSLVDYKNSSSKIKIICKEHGVFKQTPNSHLRGRKCPICYGTHKNTTEEFVINANLIHKNKYDYSLVNYITNKIKVEIICKEHGVFKQTPNSHLRGRKCPTCSLLESGTKRTKTTVEFIEDAKKIYGNKYDYSLVDYIHNRKNVIIICKEHGKFEQTPSQHLRNINCPCCSNSKKSNTKEFIEKSNKIHNNAYDYSLVDYKHSEKEVIIICKEHGEFKQIPYLHLKGHKCKKCNGYDILNTDDFIKKAKKIHNDKYDYSLVDYKNSEIKIKIICEKHGEFPQSPKNHIYNKQGCPICNINKNELLIKNNLDKNNIKYEHQKSFDGCEYVKPLRFDFYLPKYNTCIEFDGIQHYIPIEFFGGDNALKLQKIKDKIKTDYCINNNIKLIRIKYDENIEEKLNFIFSL